MKGATDTCALIVAADAVTIAMPTVDATDKHNGYEPQQARRSKGLSMQVLGVQHECGRVLTHWNTSTTRHARTRLGWLPQLKKHF